MARRFVRTKRDPLKKGVEILFEEIKLDLMGGVTLSWIYGSIVARWGVYPDKKTTSAEFAEVEEGGQNSKLRQALVPCSASVRHTQHESLPIAHWDTHCRRLGPMIPGGLLFDQKHIPGWPKAAGCLTSW